MMDALAALAWREPLWLWLALYPWLWWAWRGLLARPRGRDYADPHLWPWARVRAVDARDARRLWRHALFALAWLLFALALAGPRLPESLQGQARAGYTELMVVLDVSRSMSARDVEPGRLERARLELLDLVERADRLRIGLVVYAARPHLLNPPTHDKTVLRHQLRLIRADWLPTEGSDPGAALAFAAEAFSGGPAARALLLVTDGELATADAEAEAALETEVTRLAQQGIRLYALGMGTEDGVPLQGPAGDWLYHEGQAVVSRLQGERLEHLARMGNGRYSPVADTDADWLQLHDQGIGRLEASAMTERGEERILWRELYAWCLLPALLLLLLSRVRVPMAGRGMLPVVCCAALLAGGLGGSPVARAADAARERAAFQAYAVGDYAEARQRYATVPGFAGRMGEGSSAYRLGEYRQAVGLFTQAVLAADSDPARARALFNLANSHYRLEEYDAAVALYREVLRYAPGHAEADTNLQLALAQWELQSADGERGLSTRQGRGPRSARLAPGTDITQGSLGFDEEETGREGDASPVPDPTGQTDGRIPGIGQARTASGDEERVADAEWHYVDTTRERILLQADTFRVDEGVFWQRLFEIEEGFTAPLDEPRAIPGVRPW
ncbi:MAG TPA: VWA domain-containing protein [Gammaproteobacteria bacterium]|nr:VWA domain-containing protein [Gammaproteobacteria bacterium]